MWNFCVGGEPPYVGGEPPYPRAEMQKAASMASVLVLIFSPAVLVTFQGQIGNYSVFCHKFEHC